MTKLQDIILLVLPGTVGEFSGMKRLQDIYESGMKTTETADYREEYQNRLFTDND